MGGWIQQWAFKNVSLKLFPFIDHHEWGLRDGSPVNSTGFVAKAEHSVVKFSTYMKILYKWQVIYRLSAYC